MTIRRRHTPTTFTSIQLTMTKKNRHTPTTFNYRYSPSLTKEICNRRSSRYRRKGIPGMGEGVERRQRDKRTGWQVKRYGNPHDWRFRQNQPHWPFNIIIGNRTKEVKCGGLFIMNQ
jgi:hypothetical protein